MEHGGESESHLIKCVTAWPWLITVYLVVSETHCWCYMVRMRVPFTVQLANQVRMVTKIHKASSKSNVEHNSACDLLRVYALKTRKDAGQSTFVAAQDTILER